MKKRFDFTPILHARSGFTVCGLLLIICVSYLFGQTRETQEVIPVIATIDGEPITKDDLYIAMVELYPQQVQDALNRLVNIIIISKEATRRKVSVSDTEIKSRAEELGISGELSKTINEVIRTSLLLEKMISTEKKLKVTEDEIKKFFDENKDKLGEPEQIHLRQIFLLSETEANDILLALNAGADFAKMAKAKSQDTASRDQGGDLGFFTRGMLVPEIEKVVFEMKPKEISQVIKTSAGFHIIKLEEKKVAKIAKLDSEMKKRIEKLIFNNKIQQVLPEWLANLRKNAEIR